MNPIVNTITANNGKVFVEQYTRRSTTALTVGEFLALKSLLRRGEKTKARRMLRAVHKLDLYSAVELIKTVEEQT